MLLKLWRSLGYSLNGLKHAFLEEQSFRLEVIACLLLIPLAFYITHSLSHGVILVCACLLVLMAELFNSALELLADKVEVQHCQQIKRIKDMSSAAVFVTILIALLIWLQPLYHWLYACWIT